MKKVFSISLALLMLTAILHFSVATHYCCGIEVAKKVSISGQLAGCGMEAPEHSTPLQGTNLSNHCCDNIITSYGVSSYYTPAYSVVPESYQYNFQVLAITTELSFKSQLNFNSLYSKVSPPGALMSTNVDLSDICVFRI
jgi:hypothetical protein